MKSDAEVLAETREYIEKVGWTRGTMQDPITKKVCSLGGITLSQGWMTELHGSPWDIEPERKPDVQRVVAKVLHAIGAKTPDPSDEMAYEYIITGLTQWNDGLPSDAEQQVLDVLAKAEKVERAGFDPDAQA